MAGFLCFTGCLFVFHNSVCQQRPVEGLVARTEQMDVIVRVILPHSAVCIIDIFVYVDVEDVNIIRKRLQNRVAGIDIGIVV